MSVMKKALKPVASELMHTNKRVTRIVIFYHPDCTVGFGISPNQRCSARGLYRRSGISPCPEDVYETIIMLDLRGTFVNRKF